MTRELLWAEKNQEQVNKLSADMRTQREKCLFITNHANEPEDVIRPRKSNGIGWKKKREKSWCVVLVGFSSSSLIEGSMFLREADAVEII